MHSLRSDDAEISYDFQGSGPSVILLHPFPTHHEFWGPVIPALESRYRLILPDLRGHGASEIGQGPAFMGKHAADIARIMDAAGVGKAAFIVCSIGGYVVFEFLRRYRSRVSALALCNTRPQPVYRGSPRQSPGIPLRRCSNRELNRFSRRWFRNCSGRPVCHRGPIWWKVLSHDAQNVAGRYQPRLARNGGAPRFCAGSQAHQSAHADHHGRRRFIRQRGDGELMRQNIPGSRLKMIPKAGHYAPWERPEAVAASCCGSSWILYR